MNQKNRSIILLLFLCFVLRLVFFGFVHPWKPETEKNVILWRDALGYHQLATTMIEHHRFAYSASEEPNSVRTLLYPAFIAGVYKLFGYHPWIVLLLQIILDTLSCLLLFAALSRLFNPQIGLIAAFFYAIDPFLIMYPSHLLSDSLFLFFFVAAFYWFSSAYTSQSAKKTLLHYALSGFFIGLSTIVRPLSQYVPIIFIVFLLIRYRSRLKQAFAYSGLILVMFVLAISPQIIRNYRTFGRAAISSSGAYNLLLEYSVPMEMIRRNQRSKATQNTLISEAEQMMTADGLDPNEVTNFERGDYYQKLALKLIKENPVLFMRTYAMGLFHMFANLDTGAFTRILGVKMPTFAMKSYTNILKLIKDYFKKRGPVGVLLVAIILPFLAVTYLATLIGLLVAWRRYDTGALLFCLLIAAYVVVVTGVGGTARFRLPAIPFYLAFTGIGTAFVWEKMKQRKAIRRKT